MKITLIVLLISAVAVKGDDIVDVLDSLGFYNSVHEAIQKVLTAPVDWAAEIFCPADIENQVQVFCATSTNNTIFAEIPLGDPNAEEKINFNESTLVYIHGYLSNTRQSIVTDLKNAWATSGRPTNLCLVEWGNLASENYLIVGVKHWRCVAYYLARTYLPWLNSIGLNYSDLVLIGHSLGAHISGIIGQILYKQIQTIIGLDPAGPLFVGIPSVYRLSADDANYTQIIHTNPTLYGYPGICGDADFYINPGYLIQPDCMYPNASVLMTEIQYPVYCSHFRSVEIFIETLLDVYPPSRTKCVGVKCALALYVANMCSLSTIDYMGLDAKQIHGVFYTSTGDSAECTGSTSPL